MNKSLLVVKNEIIINYMLVILLYINNRLIMNSYNSNLGGVSNSSSNFDNQSVNDVKKESNIHIPKHIKNFNNIAFEKRKTNRRKFKKKSIYYILLIKLIMHVYVT